MLRRWLMVAALLLAMPVFAQDGPRTARALFADDEHSILRLTITGPVEQLARDRSPEGQRLPGTLKLQGDAPETLAVTLAPRGNKRREREICTFPPVELRFATKPPKDSLFAGQKQLKLVTHCRPQAQFQQHVLLEYAAYRIMNQLTPQSFRARLALIDYVGVNGQPIATRYGIVIEHVDDVARRNQMKLVTARGAFPVAQLDPQAAARFALFQELIGNLDWAMNGGQPDRQCCHNSRPIAAKGAAEGVVPVAYDFDYSGLVDAPYAVPPESIKVANVRQRRYRGYCMHNAQATAEAVRLAAERQRIVAVLASIEPMEQRVRAKATAFLAEQFDRLDDAQGTARRIASNCLKTSAVVSAAE